MSPQVRLLRVKERELCRLCLWHLSEKECCALGKIPNCNVRGCSNPHHEMLHADIKGQQAAEEPASDVSCNLLTGLGIDPGSVQRTEPEKAANNDPRHKLQLGLGIDPDTMEVKARVCKPKGQPDHGSSAKEAGGEEQHSRRLSGELLEAFTLLCQAGERFLSYPGQGRQQGSEPAIATAASQQF
jgi:hypothetical protein